MVVMEGLFFGTLVRFPSTRVGLTQTFLLGRELGIDQDPWIAANRAPCGYRPSLSHMRWALLAAREFQKWSDVMIVRRA